MKFGEAIRPVLSLAKERAAWALIVIYAAILSLEWFASPDQFGPSHFLLIVILAGMVTYNIITFLSHHAPGTLMQIELGIFLILATRLAIQVSGGMDSHLYPLYYLVYALLATVVSVAAGVFLLVFSGGMELCSLLHSSSLSAQWPQMLGHVGFAAAFGVLVGMFVKLERRGKQNAEKVLDYLRRDAADFRTTDSEFREWKSLSEQDQEKEAVRSVFALDDVFISVMTLVKKSLKGHTCALYWQDPDGQSYHLREIISDTEDIDDSAQVAPGKGLLGYVIHERKPLHLSGHQKLLYNLIYYRRDAKVRSALAAPVMERDAVLGLLIVDSLEPDAFGRKDEKLLLAFTERVREAHQHALLLRKTSGEAAKFKGLTELAHKLSHTLNLEEILKVVMRAAASIMAHDTVIITLWNEEGNKQAIIAQEGEHKARPDDPTFDLTGNLVGWVIKEKQYLYVPRLKDRNRPTPIISKRLDPKDAQSMLCYPLTMGDKALGSLLLLGKTPDLFSPYEIQVAGLVASLAAAAIANALMYHEMEMRAITDGLTGLYNHRTFQERLAGEIERANRTQTRLSLILIDIDLFKKIDDAHGHPVGDTVLKGMAQVLSEQVRKIDTAARYGGEEFVLILVGTDARGALQTAERIRKSIARLVFTGDAEFHITASLGIATYPDDALKKEDLTERADQALYHAKQHGRNQTVLYSALPDKIAAAG